MGNMNIYRFEFTRGYNNILDTKNVLAKDVGQAVDFFNRYSRHNYISSNLEIKKIELICAANVHYSASEKKGKKRR